MDFGNALISLRYILQVSDPASLLEASLMTCLLWLLDVVIRANLRHLPWPLTYRLITDTHPGILREDTATSEIASSPTPCGEGPVCVWGGGASGTSGVQAEEGGS